MADAFLATLKEFERVMLEIGETREKLDSLIKSGDQLRKQLKALGGSSQAAAPDPEAGHTLAITEIARIVRELKGSARLGEIAKSANLDVKVAATRVQRAVKVGLLVRAGHGVYQLPANQLADLASGPATDSGTANSVASSG